MATAAARFQESATPDRLPAQLYAWGARALYLGPALGLSPHRNAVAVLALGLDAPFGVAEDPERPAAGYRQCRSVLIPPDTLHHFSGTTGCMAFLYVDPCSLDLARLWAMARARTPRAAFDLSVEGDLARVLGALAARRTDWKSVRATLAAVLSGGADRKTDSRVRKALAILHEGCGARIPLRDLAGAADLSESRLRHLFRATTGVTVRRYRLWIAMGAAMRAVARGDTLTAAALDAGFSSSAHFSATFRDMFGLEPSRLAKGRLATGPAPKVT